MNDRTLTVDEKQSFYDDGYVIVKNVVPQDVLQRALQDLNQKEPRISLSKEESQTNLINKSQITPILQDMMGDFDPPSRCQVGLTPVSKPGDYFNSLGYRDKDMPFFGSQTHVDGSLTMSPPQEPQRGTEDEIYRKYITTGPRGDLGRSPDVVGINLTPLFEDPDMTLGLGSFTAFVFVCLNDQTEEGRGQTALLKGAHHEIEKFFRMQRETNNHLGVEGPGWPRIDYTVPNGCGLIYVPESVRDKFIDSDSESTPDGRKWPKPTQILMEPGDACIASYHIPHSGTRNELGTEPRKTVIFRIRNKKRQPDKVVTGVSDHPDRGFDGEWLKYETGNNPWERSKYAMCHQWHEWEGMQETVRKNQSSIQAVA